jgi:hypothetical protein
MIDAADMSGDGHPEGDPKRRALALADDDPAAKQFVAGLYNESAGRIGRLSVGGSLSTHGDDVVTLDVEGTIDTLKVQERIIAAGVGSVAVRLTGEVAGLDEATVTAAHGQDIVRWAKEAEE